MRRPGRRWQRPPEPFWTWPGPLWGRRPSRPPNAPLSPFLPCPTVADLINDFLLAKAAAGRSDRYLRQIRISLSSFAKGRLRAPATAVSVKDIEAWVFGQDWAPRTQRGYLADVSTLFNWARRRGLVEGNPAGAVEIARDPGRPPAIHTPAQAAQALEIARKSDLTTCRALAIRYFGGLRSAEAARLVESDIHLERGFIKVSAEKAKTRRRRLVTIQPTLRAWLALGGALPFGVGSNRHREFTARVKAAGVPWPNNVTRHSFVSYHLAQFGSAAKTALEAGHSEAMLFAHHRELVTPEAAAEYWAIRPAQRRQSSHRSTARPSRGSQVGIELG